jgi:hypothetical protein
MSNVPERRKGLRRLLVETDTAADDPVALVMALRHPYARPRASPTPEGRRTPYRRSSQNSSSRCLGE